MQTNQYSAGLGMQGATTQAQFGNQAAQYAGNTQIDAGQARADAILGKQNAYTGMLSGIGDSLNGVASGFMNGGSPGNAMNGLGRSLGNLAGYDYKGYNY
jgi:hypothetical protein